MRLRRNSDFSRGAFLATAGGENGSHYFKNTGQAVKITSKRLFYWPIDDVGNLAYNGTTMTGDRKKKKNLKKEHFEVLLEDINEKFDFIAENTSDILKFKPVIYKTAADVEIIKTDLEFIKGLLKRKVDTEEFEALEKRVSRLENRL